MTSVLHDEIAEQPGVIRQLLIDQGDGVARIAEHIGAAQPRFAVIAARGTSDNAARYAQYIFGALNRLTVALATPSLYGVYDRAPRLAGAVVIGISQSGQSPDIVQVLIEARRQGAPTVAITNDPQSPLARAADGVIALGAGVERSVAATKTYTSELAALALLSAHLGNDSVAKSDLLKLPDALTQALDSEVAARAAAQALAQASRCVALGRGFNYATAFEVALKIKELTHLLAEPYSTADFKHGPIAMIEPDFPVITIATGATTHDELTQMRASLLERRAISVVLGDSANGPQPGEHFVPLPGGLPEWLSPIAAIVPGQLLAYHLAYARNLDPDKPRTISKVTLTK